MGLNKENTSFFQISRVQQVDSTNRVVKEWGKSGKPQGAVLVARSQTAGRGRLGRSFFSPDSTGLYFSVLLRPACEPEQITLLTPLAAVAMAEALEQFGKSPQIKWVNDIFINDRKVCGILAESVYPEFVVLGVGVNVAPPVGGFPPSLQTVAGSVFEHPVDEQVYEHLLQRFLFHFERYYQTFPQVDYLEGYRGRNWLKGKQVTANGITGFVTDISSDFSLMVQDRQGNIHQFYTGEATIRWAACKEDELC